MYRFITLLLLLFSTNMGAQNPPSSVGKDFWVAFMENLTLTALNPPPRFSIVIAAEQPTLVKISNQAFVIEAKLEQGETREFFLNENLILYLQGSDVKGNFGIRVESSENVQVWARHYRLYFSESTLILPVDQLSDEYTVLSFLDEASGSASLRSNIAVVALQDSTVLDITPSVLVAGSPGYAARIPFQTTLNRGQVYQFQSNEDLIGTRIRARTGKKIAIFSGAVFSLAGFCNATSHLYDQVHPTRYWGRDYALLPLASEGGDLIRVLTLEPSTTFTVGCERYVIEKAGADFSFLCEAPALLKSDKPVAVAQISRGGACNASQTTGPNIKSDPSLLWLTSLNYATQRVTYMRPRYFGLNYTPPEAVLHVVFPTASTASVLVNNTPVGRRAQPMPGNSALSYARLPVETDFTEIKSPNWIWATAFTFDDLENMSENMGFNQTVVLPSPPTTTLPATLNILPKDTVCPFDLIEFKVPEGIAFRQAKWNFGNGLVSNDLRKIVEYSTLGSYKVSLTLWGDNCSAPVTYLQNLVVKKCPIPPIQPLNVTVEGNCIGLPIRVRYSPANIDRATNSASILDITGFGEVSEPDRTFIIRAIDVGLPDTFLSRIIIRYKDRYGRDTSYEIPLLLQNCFSVSRFDTLLAVGNCAGKPVRFEYGNAFSPYAGNTVLSHRWDFGIANLASDTSLAAAPTFIYDSPGVYTVKIQVIKRFAKTPVTLTARVEIKDCSTKVPEPPKPDTLFATNCQLVLRPNPAFQTATLFSNSLLRQTELPIQIFDVAGRLLFSRQIDFTRNTSASIDLIPYPAGLYLIRYWCAADNKWKTLKCVKME